MYRLKRGGKDWEGREGCKKGRLEGKNRGETERERGKAKKREG